MITLRNKRGPIATLTGSDLRAKTERGSIATHDLAGETRAAADAREAGLPTGAEAPEQAPPPGPYPDPPRDDFLQALTRVHCPRSHAHGVLVDQRAPRSGHLGVADDGDRRAVILLEFLDHVRELIGSDPGRFPRIRRLDSRGDEPRVGPRAAGTRRFKGSGAVVDAVQAAFEKTGRIPEGRDLVALIDRVEDSLPGDGETRAEARMRAAHRVQGLLRKL